MVDMCREKKTGMAEECRQSDGRSERCELVLTTRYFTGNQWSSFKSGVT